MPHDPKHDPYYDTNQLWWDEVVPIHEASRGYDRNGFLRGEEPLRPVELAELGPRIAGKALLHLQCHFGIDTLGWARHGAEVTGLDFSALAIEAARRLSAESGVPGRFIQSNVYDAPERLGEAFDVVYTGVGALNWLPNIRAWASVVAKCMKPGGVLYVYEGHPMLWTLDDQRDDGILVVGARYFELTEPAAYEGDSTYVDGPKLVPRRTYEWNHGLGEIVSAIVGVGLRIEFVHEHREVAWQALPSMEPVGPTTKRAGRYQSNEMWRLPAAQRDLVPLMYSLIATKPEA
jgi:SAM-dependent methyltransferase